MFPQRKNIKGNLKKKRLTRIAAKRYRENILNQEQMHLNECLNEPDDRGK